MSDDVQRIPVIEEDARILKRTRDVERVTVRTVPGREEIVVREALAREQVEVVRVPVDLEVAAAPPVRTEGDVTIVPIVEERLVVEKRLFVIEEVHLRRRVERSEVAMPTTLRRTRVEIDRQPVPQPEDH